MKWKCAPRSFVISIYSGACKMLAFFNHCSLLHAKMTLSFPVRLLMQTEILWGIAAYCNGILTGYSVENEFTLKWFSTQDNRKKKLIKIRKWYF